MKKFDIKALLLFFLFIAPSCYAKQEDAYVEQSTFYIKGSYNVTAIGLAKIPVGYKLQTVDFKGASPVASTTKALKDNVLPVTKIKIHQQPYTLTFSEYSLDPWGFGVGLGVALGNLRIELEGVTSRNATPLVSSDDKGAAANTRVFYIPQDPTCPPKEYSLTPPTQACTYYNYNDQGFSYNAAFLNFYSDLGYSNSDLTPFAGVGLGPVYLKFNTTAEDNSSNLKIVTLGTQLITGLIYTGFENMRPYLGYNLLFISPKNSKGKAHSTNGGTPIEVNPSYLLHKFSVGIMMPLN